MPAEILVKKLAADQWLRVRFALSHRQWFVCRPVKSGKPPVDQADDSYRNPQMSGTR
jgi:hypothetical protein